MEELAADNASLRPTNINKKDDIQAAIDWMKKGRVDTRGFSKVLPHTSQDLRDGKITPDQVANDLKAVYTGSIRLAGVEMDPIMGLSHLTSMSVLPQKFFHRSPGKQNEISVAFSKDIFHKFNERRDHGIFVGVSGVTLCLKTCVDDVCEEWADRLDAELFRGKKGMFLKKCPLYQAEPEKYHESDMPIDRYLKKIGESDGTTPDWLMKQDRIIELRQRSILAAAEYIVRGLDAINSMCWECRKVFKVSLNRCGKCDQAKYCSRECQVSAWKQGHKQKCKALRSRYTAFMKSIKAVDDAHASANSQAATQCGIALYCEMDYNVLQVSHIQPSPYEGTDAEEELGEPSMDAWYKNLGRVIRGEFWFYEDANEVAFREAHLSLEQLTKYYGMLSHHMCYDYESVAPAGEVFGETSCVMRTKEEMGVAMPSTTFIEMYQLGQQTVDTIDRKRLRRETRYQTINNFIDEWHK